MSRKPWTDPEIAMLRNLYPNMPTAKLARLLGRSESSVNGKAGPMGLHKSAEYLASPAACRLRRGDNVGAEYRFKKGQQAWNQGTHFKAGGRSVETQFKKGHRGGVAAELYRPIGTERISKDGYLERKINDGLPLQKRWRAVHLVLWEEVNGPIPKGHALVFKDRNKQNTALDNLELVTRAELMRRNSFHRYGKEIAQLVQLKGAVTRQINRREKKA